MMLKFCPQCGTSVNENQRFCNKCGVSLQPTSPYQGGEAPTAHQTYAPPPAPYAEQPPSYQPPVQSYQTGQLPSPPPYGQGSFNVGLTSNQISALCYLLPIIGGILGLVVEPYNRDRLIRFHAWQSLLFMGAWFVLKKLAIPILDFILPGFLVGLMSLGVSLGFFVGWIYLMVQTWNGVMFKVPFIGDVAEQQSSSSLR